MSSARPSFYVRRVRGDRIGWTGPIRSHRQVKRERAAWIEAGWEATIHESTPAVRAEVRAWQRSVRGRA